VRAREIGSESECYGSADPERGRSRFADAGGKDFPCAPFCGKKKKKKKKSKTKRDSWD